MRLVNVHTLELRTFSDNEVPLYAILSHTWGDDEVTFQELVWINKFRLLSSSFEEPSMASSFTSLASQDDQSSLMLASMEMLLRGSWNSGASLGSLTEEDLLKRPGYAKIVGAAQEARDLKLDWIWIDTCSIDKSSSAELQEAINSMYRWYSDAEICLVYLNDVAKPVMGDNKTASEIAWAAFNSCRWSKRGWTLQELVAPIICRFYFQDWTLMGEKVEFLDELSRATGIPPSVLDDRSSLTEVSVAERMSWAATRETTRKEDMAYCLLGLFDIQMPLLYGEGEKAFIRLQEEILKATDDYSLFSWRALSTDKSIYRGLLARSAMEFRHCRSVEREDIYSTFPISFTPIGLRIQLEFLPDPSNPDCSLAMIRSTNSLNQRLAIHLRCLDGNLQYARVNAGSLIAIDDWPSGQLRNVYVRQKLSIPHQFTSPDFSRFHIRRRIANHQMPNVRIIGVHPHELWDWNSHCLHILPTVAEANGLVLLRIQSHTYDHSLSFPIAFGFSRETGHYWCKAVAYTENEGTNQKYEVTGEWRTAAMMQVPLSVRDATTGTEARRDIAVFGTSGLAINVEIRAGLFGDSIALELLVDGLVRWS